MIAAADARRHLTTIARAPRPAGGPEESAARDYCATVLRALGFAITEEPVSYSGFPGRYATPLLGGAMATSIAVAALAAGRGAGVAAIVMLVFSLGLVALLGRWLARDGVLTLPFMRERTRNLVAMRGEPRLWLMAHLDSKSQPVPIGVRASGLVALGLVWLVALAIAIAAVAGVDVSGNGGFVAVAAGIAAIPVLLSVVGARSDGARDNASGVATVLSTVERLAPNTPVGVVLTSAEELGLAGARAWARVPARAPGTAINVDTVDDAGDVQIMYTGAMPAELAGVLAEAGKRVKLRFSVRRLVPGILTDGVALAAAGWQVVTVSKATMRTLARVHTPADTAEGMRAVGMNETAALLADAVESFSRGG
ncbi:MAG TPA: M28 family peptidase [Gemmatimonadaceae bacterium]|nr:M28 family peptidase [Gemmatimonadaceae bacterium]